MLYAPPTLKKGDKIALISTARKVSLEEMQLGIDLLTAWGLEVVLGKTIGAEDHQYAGNDALRAADLQFFLDNKDIKAIIMARGGYGTVRVMDKINFDRFVKNPKWIIGYSDYTLLHNYINYYYGIQTLHATMPINFNTNTPEALESLRKSIFGEPFEYAFKGKSIHPVNEIQGEIVGGNLSIFYALMGTPNGVNFDNKIVMLEDIGEYLYHLDRMMMALKTGRKINHLKALLVGGFTEMNDNLIPFGKTPEEIIAEHTAEYGYPIIFNAPFGHIPNNWALPMGSDIKILIDNNLVRITPL
jgi:muramoyltetrapeptide carboxypeptidase